MKRIVNYSPNSAVGILLTLLPFAIMLVVYLIGSHLRLSVNPDDKLMPSFSSIGQQIWEYAFSENRRTGGVLLWVDTWASLQRILAGLAISSVLCVVIGLPVGFIPYLQRTFGPFFDALSLIPPLAVLPILFIIFGLGEESKIVLIVVGITPFLVRDVVLAVEQIPREQIIKAQTLGASSWHMMIMVVLPQILPRLLDSIRLSLGAAWLFLIAAEAIASEAGLGYRIFIVRRYLQMDVILFYVAWITLLAYAMDYILAQSSRYFCRWYHVGKAS